MARLTDQVFPLDPVRRWTLSLPHPTRYLVVFNTDLFGDILESKPDGPLTFRPTPAPSRAEFASIAWEICTKTVALLKRRGIAYDATPEELDPTRGEKPLLAECAAASMQGVVLIGPRAGRSILRIGSSPQENENSASSLKSAHGFNLHSGRRVFAQDRPRLGGGIVEMLYVRRCSLWSCCYERNPSTAR